MEEERKDFLIKLLYDFWTDADFESDFQSDWYAVYQILHEGRFDEIPDGVFEMLEIWYNAYYEGK